LFSLEKGRLQGDLIAAFQYLKGACRRDGKYIFSRACCDKTRSNGFNLRDGRVRLDRRKKLITMRVVKHWHRLPRKVVEAPSLETFKARLNGALSMMSLLTAGRLGYMISKVPFQSKAFYDSTCIKCPSTFDSTVSAHLFNTY